MKDIKVSILSKEYPPYIYGGAGVHVDYLTKSLKKIMKINVITFGDQDYVERNLKVKGYSPWNELLTLCDDKYLKILEPFSVNLLMVKNIIDSQIIHAHTWYTFMAGFMAKKMNKIPLVTTIHSLEPLRPWKEEQLGSAYELSSWIEKTGIENSDGIIAVSKEMKKDILKFFNVKEDKIKVIHNGIDLEQYKYIGKSIYRERYGIKLDMNYILFVGRITRQKGIIHLLNAVRYINEGVQIVLCAGSPDTEEIKREISSIIKIIQKERGNIVWIDEMVSREALIELYSNASVFVCPSIYEPFGIVNLEAMACETPVVASAVGGIKEVVVDGETGFLIEYKQKENGNGELEEPEVFHKSMAERINLLLENLEMQKVFSKNARKRVENYFSWDKIARETKKLYENILS
jgi:alpha-maltose-1-phosphate synthase